jgi:hypothetical protein
MKIGLLVGMEDTFPRAFLDRLGERKVKGLEASLLTLGGTDFDAIDECDVIVDRISHEVAYYGAYLRHARLGGTRVVNDPFLTSCDDRFFDTAFAHRLGVRVPKTVLLPQKGYPETVTGASLRNLTYPIPWETHIETVGLPALLRPVGLRGWRHVARVSSLEELFAAYDLTGTEVMMLQETISWNRYVRCIVIGGQVIVARYDPEYRQYLEDADYLEPALEERCVRDASKIAKALGYDMCAVEFAIEDDVPCAVEFVNPVPDFEQSILGAFWFDKVVEAMVEHCIGLAKAGREKIDLSRPQGGGLVVSVAGIGGRPRKTAKKKAAKKKATKKKATKKKATKKKATKKKATKKKATKKKATKKAARKRRA